MASLPGIQRISLVQLRASLALVLPVSDIHAATASLPEHVEIEIEALQRTIRAVQFRLWKRYLFDLPARLTGHRREGGDSPLDRLRSRSADDALILALHLGTHLTIRQIACLLEMSTAGVSQSLLSIRLWLLDRHATPCPEYVDDLASYRDARLDRALAASISRHQTTCPECAALLQEFDALDQRLTHEVRRLEQAELVSLRTRAPVTRRLLSYVPVAGIATVFVALVLAGAGLISDFTGTAESPLFATEPENERGAQGWIIYGTWDGGLHAFDPATSQRQTLRPEYFTANMLEGANYLVAPDGERVAIFAQNEVPGLYWATRRLSIVTILGEEINEIQWNDRDEAGWPTGWLGDEVLIVSIPMYEGGETSERFLERLEEESEIRAVDVETGAQRVVFSGGVAQVIPSPDATRLAIVKPRDPTHPGTSVEIWSVSDGLAAEQIANLQHHFTWSGGLLWSQDSQSLYLGQIADYDQFINENSRDDSFRGSVTSIEIVRVDRDGEQETVVTGVPDSGTQIVGVDPDDQRIVLLRRSLEHRDQAHRFFVLDRESGELSELTLPGAEFQFRPAMNGTLGYQAGFAAHPEGFPFVLHLGSEHYIPADSDHHYAGPPQAIALTLFDRDLRSSVSAVISDRWPLTPLRWVSTDEFSPEALPRLDHASDFSTPEPVDELRPYAKLGPDSLVSPDGMALPMVEIDDDATRPYLWFPRVDTGRWVASQTRTPFWLRDSHAFLAVTELGGIDGGIFRVTQHSSNQRGGSSVDAFFDPLLLGQETDTRYAHPAASPDASLTSFFALTESTNTAELWLAGWDDGVSQVHSFAVPAESMERMPISVDWLDNTSLVFTEPLEWSDGLPIEVALNRLDLIETGEPAITEILRVGATGRDRGIALVDIALHPDGEFIAYRQRHFTDRDAPEEGYDTVHIAPASDVTGGMEIARGDMSSGLVWSPGGQALALGNGDRIGLYSVISHSLAYVSGPAQHAEHPVWISESELWFNVGEREHADVYRVRFGD